MVWGLLESRIDPRQPHSFWMESSQFDVDPYRSTDQIHSTDQIYLIITVAKLRSGVWVTSSLTNVLVPTAAALGNFDGIHLGHRQVIQPILQPVGVQPRALTVGAVGGGGSVGEATTSDRPYSTVVTFTPHPQEFFTGQPRVLLTPLAEKVEQLTQLGVEQLVLLPFDRELAQLSPQEFVEEILVRSLQTQQISIGQDFRFGYKRTGTADDLQVIAAKFGIQVNIIPLHTHDRERISSSEIRAALQSGHLERVSTLLGRPYAIQGAVISGQQVGRTLGFPTANLQVPTDKFLPRHGVYCVWVSAVDDGASRLIHQPGVLNIGCRPTLDGTQQSVEVHLLDWAEDLYGKTLVLSLVKFLRPEQKFPSLDALKTQIEVDCQAARRVLVA